MKKRLLSLALGMIVMLSAFPVAANAADGVAINSENFPDDAFRNYVSSKFDFDKNQVLSESEIAIIKQINVDQASIQDLKGIELFTSLESLTCDKNNLTSLDVTANKKLKDLSCSDNKIALLNVNNTVLDSLDCTKNLLAELDVSANSQLRSLYCSENQLTDIDLSKNPNLFSLDIRHNKLTNIDLSKNPKLNNLDVAYNELSSLDLKNNQLLDKLDCSYNWISVLNLKNNPDLYSLNCMFNQIEALDLSANTKLESIIAIHNRINQLNLTGCMRVFSLDLTFNCLTNLDFDNGLIPEDGKALNYQCVSKQVRKTADGWLLDINEMVGQENISKVKLELQEDKNWSYDESTGIAHYTGDKLPKSIVYNYNGNMAVIVKLLSAEEFVVMKEGAEQAVVNGTLAPTTKYDTGYAKMVNINGTMQMPLRYIAEVSKFSVEYNENTSQTAVASRETFEWLTITPGSPSVEKNFGFLNEHPIVSQAPLPFTVQNGVTMGPLRFTCEAMGLFVSYQETPYGNYVVISPVAKTEEEALEKIEEAYQLGL